MSLFDKLVINPNKKYDQIENGNKRFLVFFIPFALCVILLPMILIFFGVQSTLALLAQTGVMILIALWRFSYLYVENII